MEKIVNLGLQTTKAISQPVVAKVTSAISYTAENGSKKSIQLLESAGNTLRSIVKKMIQ